MASLPIYNKSGEQVGKYEIDPAKIAPKISQRRPWIPAKNIAEFFNIADQSTSPFFLGAGTSWRAVSMLPSLGVTPPPGAVARVKADVIVGQDGLTRAVRLVN